MSLVIGGEVVDLTSDEINLREDVIDAVAKAHAEHARQTILGYQTTLRWHLAKQIGEVLVKRRPTDADGG